MHCSPLTPSLCLRKHAVYSVGRAANARSEAGKRNKNNNAQFFEIL